MASVADLGRAVKKAYPGKYDDVPDARLGAAVKQAYPDKYADVKGVANPPGGLLNTLPVSPQLPGLTIGGALEKAAQAAPALGGMAGGLAGTAAGVGVGSVPFGVGGAAIGGAAGEAVKQNALRLLAAAGYQSPTLQTPADAGAALEDIAKSAAQQGAFELGGRALAGAGMGVAKGALKAATKPTKEFLADFPNVIQDLIKNRMGVKVGGGAVKAEKLFAASAQAKRLLLDQANKQGYVFDFQRVADPIIKSVEDGMGRPLTATEKQSLYGGLKDEADRILSTRSMGILPENVTQMSASDLSDLKSLAQKEAQRELRASRLGLPPVQGRPSAARGIAGSAKEQLGAVPGLNAADADLQRKIGMMRLLKAAELNNPSILAGNSAYLHYSGGMIGQAMGQGSVDPLARGGLGAAGYLLSKTALSPENLSQLAMAMSNPFVQTMLTQAPRSIAYEAQQ